MGSKKELSRKVYVAKVNLSTSIFKSDFQSLINTFQEALLKSKGIFFDDQKFTWTFVDVQLLNIKQAKYIVGKLCRSRHKTFVKRLDRKEQKTYIDAEENIAYESIFLFAPESELLAIEETRDIKRTVFVKIFSALCYKSRPEIGDIVIKFIPDKRNFEDKLSRIAQLTYVKFNLVPANFHNKPEFRELDEWLKNEQINEADVILKSIGEQGISRRIGSFFSKAVSMVFRSYGRCKIEGKTTMGKKEQFSSDDMHLYQNVVVSDDLSDNALKLSAILENAKSQIEGIDSNEK